MVSCNSRSQQGEGHSLCLISGIVRVASQIAATAPLRQQGATVGTDPPGQAETTEAAIAEAATGEAATADAATGQAATAAVSDPLPEAFGLARGAAADGLGLKLLGGLAVRVICPSFPPRLRRDQDIDFGCLSKGRKNVAAYLERNGCEPDRRFNNLNGDRQMYFTAPSGRPIDVMVDRLAMCHILDFRPTFDRLPFTLDVVDLLLSKLQIVELNEKDARDLLQLLAAMPLASGRETSGRETSRGEDRGEARHPGRHAREADGDIPQSGAQFIDTDRFSKVLGADWGWWRTVTANLEKLPALAAERPHLQPPEPPFDAAQACQRLLELAESAPKSVKWRLRANVGDRVRWYELPEEVGH
jgi:hypothetical protein